MLSTRSLVDKGHRLASCDTSLVVSISGGVDCGRRRRNVHDKKFQRYAKDNRTAHLTACSDKSVAYVTNNKRHYSTFCTVEANYWQTQSIAQPLFDSSATCFLTQLVVRRVWASYIVFGILVVWVLVKPTYFLNPTVPSLDLQIDPPTFLQPHSCSTVSNELAHNCICTM